MLISTYTIQYDTMNRKVQKKKNFISALVMIFLFLFSVFFISSTISAAKIETIATLILLTNRTANSPPYEETIQDFLSEINIKVLISDVTWAEFQNRLLEDRNWDLALIGLSTTYSPDMRVLYTKDGSLNIFGFQPDLPNYNESEDLQNLAATTTGIELRKQTYDEWQLLMMDKIVPLLPLYVPRQYSAVWANTQGYNALWGLVRSLPYMSFEGLHANQHSLNEFNLAQNSNLGFLNPLLIDDISSDFISQLLFEPLIQLNPVKIPIKTGLIYNWDKVTDTHYKFHIRENLYWNPSYNVTNRNASSIPLDQIPSDELMKGLKTNEPSTGNNQQITARDFVFTLLANANPIVSEISDYYSWIKDCYIDSTNNHTFHIIIDSNPSTIELEGLGDFWLKMSELVLLPEFFLNSTDATVTYTVGGVKCTGIYPGIKQTSQWITFSKSAFGSGMYMLNYSIPNSVNVLERSPYWFGVGAIDGTTGKQPFVETVNIRVIPDASAKLAEFKAGNLDWVSLDTFPEERRNMQDDFTYKVYTTLSNYFSFLAFNLQSPFIGGENNYKYLKVEGKENYTIATAVRKAICYSIDREQMNRDFHNGEYVIAYSCIPPTTYYYNMFVPKIRYNITLAEEYLRDAGYLKQTKALSFNNFLTVLSSLGAFVLVMKLSNRKRKRKTKF
ncbi:MAG: ABC transporter substrate-binding protein [Candidatus Heimdallarchaeaceae archaeon]